MDKQETSFYIHIGLPKSASTTLQRKISELNNEHVWAQVGVQAIGNHRVAGAILGSNSPNWIVPSSVDEIREERTNLEAGKTYHLSSETFVLPQFLKAGGPEFLAETFSSAHFVICVRDQVSLLNSAYLQRLKRGQTSASPREFVEADKLSSIANILNIIECYNALGPVSVINYHDSNIVSDYEKITGCEFPKEEEVGSLRMNVSGSYLSAAAVSSLIHPAEPLVDGAWQTNELVSLSQEMFPGEKMTFDDSLIREIALQHEEDNKVLQSKFGVDLNKEIRSIRGTHSLPGKAEVAAAARELAVRINRDRSNLLRRVKQLEGENSELRKAVENFKVSAADAKSGKKPSSISRLLKTYIRS